jgi:hypothetical protein
MPNQEDAGKWVGNQARLRLEKELVKSLVRQLRDDGDEGKRKKQQHQQSRQTRSRRHSRETDTCSPLTGGEGEIIRRKRTVQRDHKRRSRPSWRIPLEQTRREVYPANKLTEETTEAEKGLRRPERGSLRRHPLERWIPAYPKSRESREPKFLAIFVAYVVLIGIVFLRKTLRYCLAESYEKPRPVWISGQAMHKPDRRSSLQALEKRRSPSDRSASGSATERAEENSLESRDTSRDTSQRRTTVEVIHTPRSDKTEESSPVTSGRNLPKMENNKVAYLVYPMPLPGAQNAPSFNGKDVTAFLRSYEGMCKGSHLPEEEYVERFADYCTPFVAAQVSSLEGYDDNDWKGFRKELLQEFKDRDQFQKMFTREYLQAYVEKAIDGKENLKHYTQQFSAIFAKLKAKGEVTDTMGVKWFLQGLRPEVRMKVKEKAGVILGDVNTHDMKKLAQTARAYYVELEDNLELERGVAIRREGVREIVEKYRSTAAVGEPRSEEGTRDTNTTTGGIDKAMRDLAESFGAMTLPIQVTMQKMGEAAEKMAANQHSNQQRPQNQWRGGQGYGGGSYQRGGGNWNQNSQTSRGFPQQEQNSHKVSFVEGYTGLPYMETDGCFGCGRMGPNHGRHWKQCDALLSWRDKGYIEIGNDGYLTWAKGPNNGQRVNTRRGVPWGLSISEAVGQLTDPPPRNQDAAPTNNARVAEVNAIQIIDLIAEDTDDEVEGSAPWTYEYSNAATSDKPKKILTRGHLKPRLDEARRVMKTRQALEKDIPSARNTRTGRYVGEDAEKEDEDVIEVQRSPPSRDYANHQPTVEDQSEEDELDQQMVDAPVVQDNSEKKKNRKVRLGNYLKKADTEEHIEAVNEVLGNPIRLTLGQLLSITANTKFHDDLFRPVDRNILDKIRPGKASHTVNVTKLLKDVPGREKMLAKLSTVQINTLNHKEVPNLIYSRSCPIYKVLVGGNELVVKGLLDCGAEINLMREREALDAGLVYATGIGVALIGVNGRPNLAKGICQDVEITIGPAVIKQNVLILAESSHALILGMPFFAAAQATTRTRIDGTHEVSIVCPETGNTVRFQPIGVKQAKYKVLEDIRIVDLDDDEDLKD